MRVSLVQLDRTLPLDTGWHDDAPQTSRVWLSGCKAFFDGTLGSRTARLRTPYSDAPECRGTWLELAASGDERDWCAQVVNAGLAPVIHAIGDAAVGRAIDTIASVPDGLRATIEHAEIMAPEDLHRVEGLRLSVQPTHRASDAAMASERLGDRDQWVLPLRRMQAAGARLSFGTDWPIVPVDPLASLRAAITGGDAQGRPFYEEERLPATAALRAATIDAAEACGFEAGLRPGLPADFVVWNGDPFEHIQAARVQATWIDGTLVGGTTPS